MNKKSFSSSKIILSKKVTICNNAFSKGFGLMFHKMRDDFAFIFPFKRSHLIPITMYFVFFPIDIVFLDENYVVVELVNSIKPFRNYYPKNKSLFVVEFPSGLIKKHHLKLGSKLSWTNDIIYLEN